METVNKSSPTNPVTAIELNPCNSFEKITSAHKLQKDAISAKISAKIGILIISIICTRFIINKIKLIHNTPARAQSNESMTNSKLVPIIQKYAPQIEVFFRELINNRDELIEEAMDKIDPLLDDVIPEQDTEEDELGES